MRLHHRLKRLEAIHSRQGNRPLCFAWHPDGRPWPEYARAHGHDPLTKPAVIILGGREIDSDGPGYVAALRVLPGHQDTRGPRRTIWR